MNLDDALWIISAGRMKAGREHRVPLTARAVAILRAQKQIATCDLIFEGGGAGAAINDTTIVKTLRAATGDRSTLHGLRSSFRDWAGDETKHPRDGIEAALAHVLKDKTEAAYRRKDALEKRRTLMNDWETHCEQGQLPQ